MRIEQPTPSGVLSWRGLGHGGALRLVVGAGCALVVGLIFLRAQLEVVRQGDLLGRGPVREVELFGRWTLYKDAQPVGALDVLNVFLLAAIATTTLFVSALLDGADRWFWFFLVAATGAGFLAADEALSIHETIGFNLQGLPDLLGIRYPDDLIYASYVVPAAVFVYVFRREIASSTRALALFLLGGVSFAASVTLDATATRGEEFVELLATSALLAAFAGLALIRARRAFVTKS